MNIPVLLLSVYIAGIVLQYMYFSYKCGCKEKEGDYAPYLWTNRGVGLYLASPAPIIWPLIVGFFIICAPFQGLKLLGRKYGCKVKL